MAKLDQIWEKFGKQFETQVDTIPKIGPIETQRLEKRKDRSFKIQNPDDIFLHFCLSNALN